MLLELKQQNHYRYILAQRRRNFDVTHWKTKGLKKKLIEAYFENNSKVLGIQFSLFLTVLVKLKMLLRT
jgi:hypothetical protein